MDHLYAGTYYVYNELNNLVIRNEDASYKCYIALESEETLSQMQPWIELNGASTVNAH